jgi:hypothetical protein
MSGSYEAIAWLEPESDYDIEVAVMRLGEWLPEAEISRQDQTITVSLGRWDIRLHLDEDAHVAAEAKEFPNVFPECPRSLEIARCSRRVEIASPGRDPNIKYFNDYVFVLQALEEFQGVILFDPVSGELI